MAAFLWLLRITGWLFVLSFERKVFVLLVQFQNLCVLRQLFFWRTKMPKTDIFLRFLTSIEERGLYITEKIGKK